MEYRLATADEIPTLAALCWAAGIDAVTVSSSSRAVPLYQRLGFTGLPPYLRIAPPH